MFVIEPKHMLTATSPPTLPHMDPTAATGSSAVNGTSYSPGTHETTGPVQVLLNLLLKPIAQKAMLNSLLKLRQRRRLLAPAQGIRCLDLPWQYKSAAHCETCLLSETHSEHNASVTLDTVPRNARAGCVCVQEALQDPAMSLSTVAHGSSRPTRSSNYLQVRTRHARHNPATKG